MKTAGHVFRRLRGYGPQKVFAEEIALAARRVDERYGVADRRVLLVNDHRDFDRYPLASPTALARTLAGISARMDRDRDVLFLALSSHGREEAVSRRGERRAATR